MSLHFQIRLTLKLMYSSLNAHLCCNLCPHLSLVFLSGSQGKNDISVSLEFWDAVAPHHHGNCSFRHRSPGVLCNVCPNSLCSQLCLTSCCTSSLTSCNTYYTLSWQSYVLSHSWFNDLSFVYAEASPFVFPHHITISVSHHHSWHASWVPDLLSLRFSVRLAKQTAVFPSCIYKFGVPGKTGKQQQVAAHHSEQYSLRMKIHLFWYSN